MADQQIGHWLVLREVGRDNFGQVLWLCRCICGTERPVIGSTLRKGTNRKVPLSCGCIHRYTPEQRRTWFDSMLLETANGCLEFQGSRDKDGYGRFSWTPEKGKEILIRAHRWIYQVTHGPLTKNDLIMHSCDNPPCCNIKHLSLGTQKDNVQDCIAKGRRNERGRKNKCL